MRGLLNELEQDGHGGLNGLSPMFSYVEILQKHVHEPLKVWPKVSL